MFSRGKKKWKNHLSHHKVTERTKGLLMDTKERANGLSREVIGAAIEVHKALGPGLLKSAYEGCLCQELKMRKYPF